MSSTILVVDDEARFREILGLALQRAGHRVLAAGDGRAALALLETETVDVVMSDLRMPQMDGRSLLTAVKQRWPNVPVVVVTAHASLKDAVRTIKEGAFDYVSKPFEIDELERVIHNALALHRALDENARLQGELGARYGLERLIGISPAHRRIVEAVREVAQNRANVLLTGESGTGKSQLARVIHDNSARASQPFVELNCAAIPETLIESELFGALAGAHSTATRRVEGKLAAAERGTLFLDEVGELSASAQSKLLRALQEGEVERIGDTRTRKVDVRVVAATNVDLEQAVQERRFRKDLFYRLNIYPVTIPPLRERKEDIALLARRFLDKCSARHDKKVSSISDEALHALQGYDWPGNVRELENVIERGVILAQPGGAIELGDLFPSITSDLTKKRQLTGLARDGSVRAHDEHTVGAFLDHVLRHGVGLDGVEGLLLDAALTRSGGNVASAARLLGMTRPQFAYRLKRHGRSGASTCAPGPAAALRLDRPRLQSSKIFDETATACSLPRLRCSRSAAADLSSALLTKASPSLRPGSTPMFQSAGRPFAARYSPRSWMTFARPTSRSSIS